MDVTSFSQTMDIDVDFEGNQSYQPTRMMSMFAGNQHTFNFEDTEVTFEFTRYIQQLCSDMEDAKNRIDSGDTESVKNLLASLIDQVQHDISIVNTSINSTLNVTNSNTTKNNSTACNLDATGLNKSSTKADSKNETSILGLLHDLFSVERKDRSPIQTIRKMNVLSRSLRDVSSTLSNLSMNTTVNERSMLKSIEEEQNKKENVTLSSDPLHENSISNLTAAEATFINNSVCSPLMELISAVEKKIDIEKIEEGLKIEYETKLKLKDDVISKLEEDLLSLKANLDEKTRNHEETVEQLSRARKENEVLDEIISDEKRKLLEKQSTVEELNVQISDQMNQISSAEKNIIELTEKVNRMSVIENMNQSLKKQVEDLMAKTNKMFELERQITMLNVECDEKSSRIENISYELKTNQELNERLSKERLELMNRLDVLTKQDTDKGVMIDELKNETANLAAKLSLQNDKCDFLNAKLKETSDLKNQLEKDRKDVCWQINELLENRDADFDDLKKFLVLVEEKINSVDTKKPKGAAFVKSLFGQTTRSASVNNV